MVYKNQVRPTFLMSNLHFNFYSVDKHACTCLPIFYEATPSQNSILMCMCNAEKIECAPNRLTHFLALVTPLQKYMNNRRNIFCIIKYWIFIPVFLLSVSYSPSMCPAPTCDHSFLTWSKTNDHFAKKSLWSLPSWLQLCWKLTRTCRDDSIWFEFILGVVGRYWEYNLLMLIIIVVINIIR